MFPIQFHLFFFFLIIIMRLPVIAFSIARLTQGLSWGNLFYSLLPNFFNMFLFLLFTLCFSSSFKKKKQFLYLIGLQFWIFFQCHFLLYTYLRRVLTFRHLICIISKQCVHLHICSYSIFDVFVRHLNNSIDLKTFQYDSFIFDTNFIFREW